MLSIIDEGDEVIMLAPFWVSYEITVRFAGGTPVVLPAGVEEDYKVPARRIAAAMTPQTKLLILNSPSQSDRVRCGRPPNLRQSPTSCARIRSMMVLSDEIYEYIMFDGEMASIGALPGMRERTITVNGFSKGFAMTGWRLGYAAAAEPVDQGHGPHAEHHHRRRQPVRAARRHRCPRRSARRGRSACGCGTGRGATWCWLACAPLKA